MAGQWQRSMLALFGGALVALGSVSASSLKSKLMPRTCEEAVRAALYLSRAPWTKNEILAYFRFGLSEKDSNLTDLQKSVRFWSNRELKREASFAELIDWVRIHGGFWQVASLVKSDIKINDVPADWDLGRTAHILNDIMTKLKLPIDTTTFSGASSEAVDQILKTYGVKGSPKAWLNQRLV